MFIVNEYDFGRIVINNETYTRDVIITPSRIIKNWWRKEGHRVCLEDLKELENEDFEFLIIGTGYYGIVSVDREVIEYFERKGIRTILKPSREAVDEYNRLVKEGKKVVLAIHLTC